MIRRPPRSTAFPTQRSSDLTVTVSVSIVAPLKISVNVIVPVGLRPPDRTAESLSVIVLVPSGALVGFGVVAIDGFAALVATSPLWAALVRVAVVVESRTRCFGVLVVVPRGW